MGYTNAIGFFFVVLVTLHSIEDMCTWVSSLPYPHWAKVIGYILALALWFLGISFLYYTEQAMRNRKKKDEHE